MTLFVTLHGDLCEALRGPPQDLLRTSVEPPEPPRNLHVTFAELSQDLHGAFLFNRSAPPPFTAPPRDRDPYIPAGASHHP